MRSLYKWLLQMHPKSFRERFGEEMLCTFDDGRATEGALRLMLDGFVSLLRQWVFCPRMQSAALPVTEEGRQMFAPLTFPRRSLQLEMVRLIMGGIISLALLIGSVSLIGGGAHLRGRRAIYSGETELAQSLMPSDLTSVSDECVPGVERGCRAQADGSHTRSEARSEPPPNAGKQARPYELPYPSGRFGIGQVSYRFTDTAYDLVLPSNSQNDALKLVIWYPADVDPDTSAPVQNVWGYSEATGKFVETHTVQGAKVAEGSSQFPLILFRQEAGNSSAAYLSQIENLVSHGYVVAAIEPAEELSAAAFGDTRLAPFEGDMRRAFFFPASRKPDAVLRRAEGFELNRERVASAELRSAFDQIILLTSESRNLVPFAHRVDLEHVGAFGHGTGGNTVARFCESDPRILACLDEDGWTPDGPLFAADHSDLPHQPFLWIDLRLETPDAAELMYSRVSRNEFTQLANDSEAAANSELRSLPAGAYRLSLLTAALTDKNFTDGPLIWSMRRVNRDNREDFKARTVLAVTNIYARAFFDKYLNNKPEPLLDGHADSPFPKIRLQRYPAKK